MTKPVETKKNVKGRPERGDFFKISPSELVLSDGARFNGFSPIWQSEKYEGEVVFNTGMTGYVESLTDPSYSGQILVFTYPLIGNYGALSNSSWESDKIYAAGVVVSEACTNWSHSASQSSLLEWLQQQNIPIITGIDTRELTKHLRSRGTMSGVITDKIGSAAPLNNLKTVKVKLQPPKVYNEHESKLVIVVDCGMKQNILRSLLALPLQVKRVAYNYDYSGESYDGLLISNGPGDPTDYPETIAIAAKAMKLGRPMFGICLGTQIMGLAAGAQTYKLPFGHRGHNQPCIEPENGRCVITSQNHGYAIDETTLPKGWKVIFRNLNDGSVEGIAHNTKPFWSVQFHPEATPGPTDTKGLFERFYASL